MTKTQAANWTNKLRQDDTRSILITWRKLITMEKYNFNGEIRHQKRTTAQDKLDTV